MPGIASLTGIDGKNFYDERQLYIQPTDTLQDYCLWTRRKTLPCADLNPQAGPPLALRTSTCNFFVTPFYQREKRYP